MKRTDNDTWDLASSVGATATMVATARAAASRQPDPIINDPYAEPLVLAAGVELFTLLAKGDLDFADIGSGWIPDYFGVRGWFFDGFFPSALSAGIRQAVIVGSGLDSRAYRLHWPADAIAYEIDQPQVIEFKKRTLAGVGAAPAVQLRTVGVDLRHDWPTALREAGFDAKQPTAWLVEGLMIGYLPGDAQNRMLDLITQLSAPGSRLSADHLPLTSKSIGSLISETAESWRQQGYDVDFGNLTYSHKRNDAEAHLRALGWRITAYRLDDLLGAAGVPVGEMDTGPDHQGAIHYLTATRIDRNDESEDPQ
ncbi:putative S-adenosyl-L-methionine-dependent methyltransferase [Mycobacterium kubicae]|uniref:S-adenosyl-L-methionine-dependent methyltransferase n=1 Tax=Mycobacterium kubicae TaxID=120959 RepID=A0AAX1JCN1_9MYCO|nr:SAM-dependent methyltransferase [Mycobacterium kubicae]MCV7098571.1 SAM-dependent methyltransferase [Mycobacterium kubicae]ORV95844.1 SAM-dependent methyltransferase [Mycobacterium kubicae]QNI11015.1 SAM-dependent methyltransferase [Mycobacterium kubicae]QPI39229.1 SAM-dependent methyltransferase [Mycobacterium kubicae]GFG63770.1 putative S-adenosyl-L-methionine-dependent methyltransferase [Mycobacterium kubicae]